MRLGVMFWYITGMTIWGSVSDIRKKTVSLLFLLLTGAGVIPIAVWERNIPFAARLFGIALGGVFFLIGFLTKEAVGKGDAAMIGICGAALGLSATVMVLCIGLVFASIVSLLLLCLGKAGRKSRIPFFPFLAMGELTTALFVLL